MKRLMILGVLAAAAIAGFFVLTDQPQEPLPAIPVADQAETVPEDAVAEPEDAVAASDVPTEAVEESAAEEAIEPEERPIILAQAEDAAADRDWKYEEGTHYARLVPTQPTVGGADKIEVAEFFWYGCAHCYDFETYIDRWLENKPANARFVRIPAVWNPLVQLHAQLYYTEEVLTNNGKIADPARFRASVFAEYHRRGNRLASESAIQSHFAKHGVSEEDFQSTWSSFEVAQKMRVAQDLARRYAISSVPAVVVNGKYRTGAGEAGGYPPLMELIDELIEKESIQ